MVAGLFILFCTVNKNVHFFLLIMAHIDLRIMIILEGKVTCQLLRITPKTGSGASFLMAAEMIAPPAVQKKLQQEENVV
jgi:hypothetical protein